MECQGAAAHASNLVQSFPGMAMRSRSANSASAPSSDSGLLNSAPSMLDSAMCGRY